MKRILGLFAVVCLFALVAVAAAQNDCIADLDNVVIGGSGCPIVETSQLLDGEESHDLELTVLLVGGGSADVSYVWACDAQTFVELEVEDWGMAYQVYVVVPDFDPYMITYGEWDWDSSGYLWTNTWLTITESVQQTIYNATGATCASQSGDPYFRINS